MLTEQFGYYPTHTFLRMKSKLQGMALTTQSGHNKTRTKQSWLTIIIVFASTCGVAILILLGFIFLKNVSMQKLIFTFREKNARITYMENIPLELAGRGMWSQQYGALPHCG